MKKVLPIIMVSLVLFVLAPMQISSAKEVKIGIIDVQKILKESKKANEAKEQFLKEMNAKRSLLREKQLAWKTLQDNFKKDEKGLSAPKKKKRLDEISQETKELRRLQADIEEELKKKDRDLGQRLLKEIRETSQDLLEKEGYTLILDKKLLVAADAAIDVTDKIIKMYDARKK